MKTHTHTHAQPQDCLEKFIQTSGYMTDVAFTEMEQYACDEMLNEVGCWFMEGRQRAGNCYCNKTLVD